MRVRANDHAPVLRAARDRIADEITARGGQPATVGEFDLRRGNGSHEQRLASMADTQRYTELIGALVAPSRVMTRNADTGQVTVRYPEQATCPSGHLAEGDKPFCPTCGGPIAAPELGSVWQDDETLAAERCRAAGNPGRLIRKSKAPRVTEPHDASGTRADQAARVPLNAATT